MVASMALASPETGKEALQALRSTGLPRAMVGSEVASSDLSAMRIASHPSVQRANEDQRHNHLAQHAANRAPRCALLSLSRRRMGQTRAGQRTFGAEARRCQLVAKGGRRTPGGRGGLPLLPLREHHQGRAPIGKAFAPQQVVRLEVAKLHELGKLRIAQGSILLTLASKIPLHL
jgi:hypothetical protein